MRALAIFLFAASCMGQGFTHNNPGFMVFRGATNPCDMSLEVTNIPYLAAWYVADNAVTNTSGQVTNWPTFGPMAWGLTNTGARAPYVSNAWLNGHSVIKFDGVDDFISLDPAGCNVNTIQVCWVGQIYGGQQSKQIYNLVTNWYMEPVIYESLYSIAYNGQWSGQGFSFTSTNFNIFYDLYNQTGSNLSVYYNNAFVEGTAGTSFTNVNLNAIYLGCEYPDYGHAQFLIAEMAIFTNFISGANRTNLYNYWCCKYGLSLVTNTTIEFDPRTVGSLQYWFRGDGKMWKDKDMSLRVTASGDKVSVWEDQSGNARHVTVSGSSAPQWTTSGGGGRPGVVFAGASTNLMRTGDPTFSGSPDSSNIVFTVQYITTLTNYDRHEYNVVFSSGHSSSPPSRQSSGIDTFPETAPSYRFWGGESDAFLKYYGSPTASGPLTNVSVFRNIFAGSKSTIWTNMVLAQTNSGVFSDTTNSGIVLGNVRELNTGFVGNIIELLFYTGTLTSNAIYQVEAYLTNRYSIHP